MHEKIFKACIVSALDVSSEVVDVQEFNPIGNSFFDRSYFGTRVLILAPRQGDEIVVAGNMILNLTLAKAEVFIAYSDCDSWTDELAAAMKILNVPREKVLFLDEKNLSADLKKILLELRADIIFYAVDYTKLAACFEKILDEILVECSDYRPEIYQRFALATAINSVPDFYAYNLFSTRKPKRGVTDDYDFDLVDRANFSWENRVRFPVNENCRKTLLKNNPLANALLAYKSRSQEFSALKILNSDEIFFERRTDNQIFHAKNPFAFRAPPYVIEFDEAVQVQRVAIYGNFLDETPAKILLRLELDNFSVTIDKDNFSIDNFQEVQLKLPARGLPAVCDMKKIFVRRAEIIPLEVGKDFGIDNVEFFANANPLREISPFIKLGVGRDFFYKLIIPYEVEKIPLNIYKFHVDEPVKIWAEADGKEVLTEIFSDNEELILNLKDARKIILTAEVLGNADIYDRAVIQRVGDLTQIHLKFRQWIDKLGGS